MMEELPAFTFGISGIESAFEIPQCASARFLGRSLSTGTRKATKYLYKVSENGDHDTPNKGIEQRVGKSNGVQRKSDQRQSWAAKS